MKLTRRAKYGNRKVTFEGQTFDSKKEFAPPDGVVCDPFSGSGTTCQAAFESNRRFIGADIRQSQVDLYRRRMATVTPDLAFA